MSDYLYDSPGFLEGMSRVLDLGGTMVRFNYSPTPEVADARARLADRRALEEDMARATAEVEAPHVEP